MPLSRSKQPRAGVNKKGTLRNVRYDDSYFLVWSSCTGTLKEGPIKENYTVSKWRGRTYMGAMAT